MKKVLRRQLTINGIVQGVGFRPYIFSLAHDIGLAGSVFNSSAGVIVELQGSAQQLMDFDRRLHLEAPPLAAITSVDSKPLTPSSENDFTIIASRDNAAVSTLISPDVTICPDCLEELFDPANRRYGYPFINCTNCGPRYTIIENIPYDRPFTSMKHFPLCPLCKSEYEDPRDRRFHAQPNACPSCGPRVWLSQVSGEQLETANPILDTVNFLQQGKIVAIKGLGGFHLAVNAGDAEAVARLRRAKGRDEKPLALMVKDMEVATNLVVLNQAEKQALQSLQSPIVLCSSLGQASIADNVAPGHDRLGIMLPYTPLHHLLLSHQLDTLVMTSANFSEEPICIGNEEALDRLGDLADYYLLHDRDIHIRSDDSVVLDMSGAIRPLRRSRGFAPRPLFLKQSGPAILAVGAELKNVVAISKAEKVFLSQHIGDLENLEAFEFFKMTIQHLQKIFDIEPELIVHDLHPGYLSTNWAQDQDVPVLGVQHHHAHLAACMAENALEEPVIGVIMDGTGYGTDGTIWGGEFLVGEPGHFERKAHFQPMPLPGGEAAIRSPWRIGLSYLHETCPHEVDSIPALQDRDTQPIVEVLRARLNTPLTSSCGRLFDAVAALSGGRQEINYEAQAAIEFMQAAQNRLGGDGTVFTSISEQGVKVIQMESIMTELTSRIKMDYGLTQMSQWFHHSLVKTFTHLAKRLRDETGIHKAVLSGGVFQNPLLFQGLLGTLRAEAFDVYTHSLVPTNDGGIALGQVLIGQNHLGR